MGAPVQVNVAAQHQFRAPKLTLCLGFAFMPSVESWCLEGDGPGRCERGVRGHNRDRAFR